MYAKKLKEKIASNRTIVYIDETTFNSTLRQSRVWQYYKKPVPFAVGKRIGSITLYGAIGHCLKEPVFMLGKSTNKEEFQTFIEKVVAAKVNPRQKPLLVIDNHAAHKSTAVKQLLQKHFVVFYMPAQSCEFNSIEHLWADIKRRFRQSLAEKPFAYQTQDRVTALVQ